MANAESLQREVQRIGEALDVDITFCARQLSTGEQIGLKEGEYRAMCSTMKVPIAITLLDLVDKGQVSMDDMHTFTRKDLRMGGWLTEPLIKNNGKIALSTYSVIDAALRMSDNAAWLRMVDLCGGIEAVQAFNGDHGFGGIRSTNTVLATYPELLESLGYEHFVPPGGLRPEHRRKVFEQELTPDRDSCTAECMVELLASLRAGDLLSEAGTGTILDIMANCETSGAKLRAMLPPGTPVRDKTGTIAGFAAADVGIVELPAGAGEFVIAMFSAAAETTPEKLDLALAHTGRLAYDYFVIG